MRNLEHSHDDSQSKHPKGFRQEQKDVEKYEHRNLTFRCSPCFSMTSAYGKAFTVNGKPAQSQRAISSSMYCQTYGRVTSRFRPNPPRIATSASWRSKTLISLSMMNCLQFRQSTKKLRLSIVRQLISRTEVFPLCQNTS